MCVDVRLTSKAISEQSAKVAIYVSKGHRPWQSKSTRELTYIDVNA